MHELFVSRIGPRLVAGLLCALGLCLSGCASTESTSSSRSGSPSTPIWSVEEAAARLRSAARKWEGTPHKWGGESKTGVDCSGLVQSVFRNQFQTSVPRTTEQQVNVGRTVSRDQLQPGDLVFFRPGVKKRHVGIYIADGQFLHASSSSGVTVSPLSRSYWQKHWWQGRRILSLSGAADASAVDSPSPSSASQGEANATVW